MDRSDKSSLEAALAEALRPFAEYGRALLRNNEFANETSEDRIFACYDPLFGTDHHLSVRDFERADALLSSSAEGAVLNTTEEPRS
jgi:hypothetical protein